MVPKRPIAVHTLSKAAIADRFQQSPGSRVGGGFWLGRFRGCWSALPEGRLGYGSAGRQPVTAYYATGPICGACPAPPSPRPKERRIPWPAKPRKWLNSKPRSTRRRHGWTRMSRPRPIKSPACEARKKGQVPFAGTARSVLRENWTYPPSCTRGETPHVVRAFRDRFPGRFLRRFRDRDGVFHGSPPWLLRLLAVMPKLLEIGHVGRQSFQVFFQFRRTSILSSAGRIFRHGPRFPQIQSQAMFRSGAMASSAFQNSGGC